MSNELEMLLKYDRLVMGMVILGILWVIFAAVLFASTKNIDTLEQDLKTITIRYENTQGTKMNKWKIEYDNNVENINEELKEWWIVSNGGISITLTSEKDARRLADHLNETGFMKDKILGDKK